MNTLYANRSIYRSYTKSKNLYPFNLSIDETDLFIQTSKPHLKKDAEFIVNKTRKIIVNHIKKYPTFKDSLKPLENNPSFHPVIKKMINASKLANVGPMAAVAGALSQETGEFLLKHCDEVIIENGGDIFINKKGQFTTGIYAGKNSPFSNKLAIKLNIKEGLGICTSSSQIGHSLSFGNADAVTIISKCSYTADAFATSLCNMVKSVEDIEKAIDHAKKFKSIEGLMIIIKDKIGIYGDLELVRL